jgi:hypothetical protein
MFGHEIDRGGRDELRRHDEIPFILATGIIHHDDHFAFAHVGDDGFNGVKLTFHAAASMVVIESGNVTTGTNRAILYGAFSNGGPSAGLRPAATSPAGEFANFAAISRVSDLVVAHWAALRNQHGNWKTRSGTRVACVPGPGRRGGAPAPTFTMFMQFMVFFVCAAIEPD